MSTLQEQLAAAKAKVEQDTGADNEGAGADLKQAVETDTTNASAGEEQDPVELGAVQPEPLVFPEVYEPKEGDYRNIRLTSLVMPNGDKIKPNKYGYYTDLTPDQDAYIQYFVEKGLVEKV